MPNIISSKIPMIYQFVLHIQYLSVMSAASTALVHCSAMFATSAFNFDCLHTMYITTNIIIIVIIAVVKRSTSTRKHLRKEPNLEFIFASSISFSFYFQHSLFIFVLIYQCFQCFVGNEQTWANFKGF